ncbi:MAG TPA: M24 family metallopeptidase, partial [Desulfotomaculum sp.]|nr:M24 family metallopeptidase [Desulfotomaculum sp.]
MIIKKSERELSYMRDAGRIVALTLQELEKAIKPGVTTGELDALAEGFIRRQGAEPAFKGLYGFPASICTSVNEQVVHGIPGPRRLQEGDIISIDVGTLINGYYGDGAATFAVGKIDKDAKRLLQVTREALLDYLLRGLKRSGGSGARGVKRVLERLFFQPLEE